MKNGGSREAFPFSSRAWRDASGGTLRSGPKMAWNSPAPKGPSSRAARPSISVTAEKLAQPAYCPGTVRAHFSAPYPPMDNPMT